jgi:hypothetical protein
MKTVIAIAFLAFFIFTASSPLAFADDEADDDNEQERQEEGSENENRLPGFEIALAIASSLGAARLLRRGC